MIIPNKERVEESLRPFLQDAVLEVREKATNILAHFDQLEQLSEDEIDALGNMLHTYCIEAQHGFWGKFLPLDSINSLIAYKIYA